MDAKQKRETSAERAAAGDALPPGCELIEIHVAELRQLFEAMDPSPFRARDLAPSADEFIVGWARELPRHAPLVLQVLLDRTAGLADEPAILREAIRAHFTHRSQTTRRQLRQLFRVGRISLSIGLACLALSVVVGDLLASAWGNRRFAAVVGESLLIGGWVAMWRPIEIFLYDWWPLRSEVRLFDRLSIMPVRIEYAAHASTEAWRADWPAASAPPRARPPR